MFAPSDIIESVVHDDLLLFLSVVTVGVCLSVLLVGVDDGYVVIVGYKLWAGICVVVIRVGVIVNRVG
jgi:hypothetical protein